MLELEFLKRVDWQIVPEPAVLDAYYLNMVAQDPRYSLESGNENEMESEAERMELMQ